MELTITHHERTTIEARGGYHFDAYRRGTFERLVGPSHATDDLLIEYFRSSPCSSDIPFSRCRTWDTQTFNYQKHAACMHKHRMTMHSIVTGEAEFLRDYPHFKELHPTMRSAILSLASVPWEPIGKSRFNYYWIRANFLLPLFLYSTPLSGRGHSLPPQPLVRAQWEVSRDQSWPSI